NSHWDKSFSCFDSAVQILGMRLTSIAFSDMNPFPSRLLRNRQALHLERLQRELRELEEQQRKFVMKTTQRKSDQQFSKLISH
uniref:Uncharacterized protein n=1 Tax=Monopterus albus TaxID=43700 RepID=A0A3Q3K6P0_MONAL